MTKRIIRLLLLSVILFTFSCCNQTQEPDDDLHLTVAWKEDIYTWGHTIDYENKIMFCEITTDSGNDYTNDFRRISAFDLESLDFLWETEDTGYNDVPPVFDDSNVYIMHDSYDKRKISVIDKKSGKIKKQTDVPYANTRMCLWTLYNGTLYWGGRDRHFMYAYSTTEEDGVRKIWGNEDVTSDIMGDIVPYNGRLYFHTGDRDKVSYSSSYLISMNPDGSDIKKLKISADFWYVDSNCTKFYKGKLYLNGMYLICVNPKTMKIEWERRGDDSCINNSLVGGEGFTIDNDRIYLMNNHGNAFFCINAKNGKVVWKERINTSFYGSIFYSPVVYGGYVYQPAQDCMIVFNAENGKYAGRDERIRTGTLSMGVTKQYKDLMIFSGTCRKTHIVKMDMHTR